MMQRKKKKTMKKGIANLASTALKSSTAKIIAVCVAVWMALWLGFVSSSWLAAQAHSNVAAQPLVSSVQPRSNETPRRPAPRHRSRPISNPTLGGAASTSNTVPCPSLPTAGAVAPNGGKDGTGQESAGRIPPADVPGLQNEQYRDQSVTAAPVVAFVTTNREAHVVWVWVPPSPYSRRLDARILATPATSILVTRRLDPGFKPFRR